MDTRFTPLLLVSLIHLLSRISAHEFLLPGTSLSVEDSSDTLHSPNGAFTCGFNNISHNAFVFSIWYTSTAEKTVIWSANHLHPVYSWGSEVMLDTDGRLAVKDYNGQPVWENHVNSSSSAEKAQLLDTGNLIVKGQGDIILWQSFDSPTDTLLPNQNITATTKLISANRLLVRGNYSFRFDDEHLLTLFHDRKDISFIYWPDPNTNIWAKQRNSFQTTTIGVLDSWGYFLGSDNLTFNATDWGVGVMRRLRLDYDGNLRLYSLNKPDGRWSVTWMAFLRTCSVRGLCGMNGICLYTPRPSCACAPGHEIIDQSDRSKGCRPKFNLSCDEQEIKFVKLPSTDFRGYDQSKYPVVSLRACKKICWKDCNCKGFFYLNGDGSCYPKSFLGGGVTSPQLAGSIYLKLPKALQVLRSSIPHSQPFGPKYVPKCDEKNKIFTVDFLDESKSIQSGPQYLYFYGFLSVIFCVEVIFVALGYWFILRREGKQLTGVWPAEVGYEMITNHFRRYTYTELQKATRQFKDQIGRGASGFVYKGVLKDKRAVAVKRLADIKQGEEEFQQELSVIGRIYHMNLVRVWGFCTDGPHRILVLEYVENGSLDKTLFSSKGSHILLEWNKRFKIALGVAKGLSYLHHECLEWVIHCDLKPENILLDEKLEPKITDFGLAKLLNRGGSNKSVSRIHGTRGYLAPEWVSSAPITAKVDVYSFGVVLLELLKGARVSEWASDADEDVEMVLGRVIRMLAENLMLDGGEQLWIADFIDSRLDRQFDKVQARTMVTLAVSCVEEDSRKRPTMENVVQMLLSVDEASGIVQQYSTS
ncbi:putative receptor protein kinase ZmPK1 [Lolium rigidum]|uniref:putative receptor protein kinase ZmPK1 n=1 Tax=Lolium rigidum TaxID=89674 RepID=UPI001F5D3085|nr:putative receptor protein kinase ZmPK1 [Lolium rigidum]